MEKGVELQPFITKGSQGAVEGFNVTQKNLQRASNNDVDLAGFEYYDYCFCLWKETKNPEKLYSVDETNNIILEICTARKDDVHFADYKSVASLHEIYRIDESICTGMSQSKLQKLIARTFRNWLRAIGCEVRALENTSKDSFFILARLSDEACRRLAEKHLTPLQIDMEAVPFPEFVEDPDFVTPFHVFDQAIENLASSHGAMKTIGHIWTRYDKLSRRVEGVDFNPSSTELSIFRDVDRIRLLNREIRDFWNVQKLVKYNFFNRDPFVLQQTPNLQILKNNWANLRKTCSLSQPLDEVRDYFGEEVAMYFAFKILYTRLLMWPSILGIILYCFERYLDPHLQFDHRWMNMGRAFYCVFLCLWATWFYQHWARREQLLRIRWGIQVSGMRRLPQQRSSFKEDGWKRNPIFPDKWEKFSSPYKLRNRQIITALVSVVATLICVIIVNNDIQEAVFRAFAIEGNWGFVDVFQWLMGFVMVGVLAQYIPSVGSLFFGLMVKILDKLWKAKFAYPLTNFENLQYDYQYKDSVATKLFLFKFFDHFSALFYLGFFKEFFQPCTSMAGGVCLIDLRKALVTLFSLGILDSFKDIAQPVWAIIKKRVMAGQITSIMAPLEASEVAQVEAQYFRDEYVGKKGLINDWLDTMVQFGLLSLFSMVMPLLPAIAVIANLIDMRLDALRITSLYRRPFPRPAGDIGFWRTVIRFMGFLAVLCNIVLCVFVVFGKNRTVDYKLSFCLAFLIGALALREYIQWKIPESSRRARWLMKRMHLTMYFAMWGDEDELMEPPAHQHPHKPLSDGKSAPQVDYISDLFRT